MIASVRGRVAAIGPDQVTVEVGGIGLAVQCSPATLAGLRAGEQTRLATSLVVREDSLTLYGFAEQDERVLFDLLQTVSGVGPRLALAVLATLRPDAVRRAVATEDLTALVRVPGVGRKGAQRLVLELKDRIGAPTAAAGVSAVDTRAPWRSTLVDALTGLGWTARDADTAADAAARLAEEQLAGDGIDVAVLLRAALRALA